MKRVKNTATLLLVVLMTSIELFTIYRYSMVYKGIYNMMIYIGCILLQINLTYMILFRPCQLKVKHRNRIAVVILLIIVPIMMFVFKPSVTYEKGIDILYNDFISREYQLVVHEKQINTVDVINNPSAFLIANKAYYYRFENEVGYVFYSVNPMSGKGIELESDFFGELPKVKEIRDVLKDKIDKPLKIESAADTECEIDTQTEIAIIKYSFPEGEPGSLPIERAILTVNEDTRSSVNLTFNLRDGLEEVQVLVLNSQGELVNSYPTEYSKLQIEEIEMTIERHVYKASLDQLYDYKDYEYVIEASGQYSEPTRFSVLEEKPMTFGFFGDTQGYLLSQYDDFRTTYELAQELSGGLDISYIAGDIVDDGNDFDQWLFFDEAMSDLLKQETFVTAIGNHDVKISSAIYESSFNYPENGIIGLEERNFYFDIPYGRIAVFDTESSELFDQQSEWLVQVMEESDQLFKIVLMHRSAYPMAYNEQYIRNLGVVFEEAGIDLVLSGHDHIYSRTSMFQDEIVNVGEGVTYICGGSSSGSKIYDILDEDLRYWKQIVYEEKNPVFTLIDISEDKIIVKAYGVVDGQEKLMDFFELKSSYESIDE